MEQALLTQSSEPIASPPSGRFARRNERRKLSVYDRKPSRWLVFSITRDAENIFHKYRWAQRDYEGKLNTNEVSVVCPYCGSTHITQIGNEYKYKCNSCKNRFNDKTKTLLHGSKLSVQVWMLGLYEILSTNYISSIELATKLGINQKSAWLMLSKLRYALDESDIVLCEENVSEAEHVSSDGDSEERKDWISMDEAYLGGCLTNYHYSRKLRLLKERHFITDFSIEDAKKRGKRLYEKSDIYALNSSLKVPVFGMTDKDKVVLYATPNPIKKEYVREIYKGHVKGECLAVSDESKLYEGWTETFNSPLVTNNHHNNHYTTHSETLHAQVSSNRIENRFSWLKRGFNGRITHCKYHQLYLNEWCFRFNTRYMSTEDRMGRAIEKIRVSRVTLAMIRQSVPELWSETKHGVRFKVKRAKCGVKRNTKYSLTPEDIEKRPEWNVGKRNT